MAVRLSERCRPTQLLEHLDRLTEANRAAWIRTWVITAVVTVGGIGLFVWVEYLTGMDGLAFGMGISMLVLAGIGTFALLQRKRLTDGKLAFARGLCARLTDDFHPAKKVTVELDIRPYDQGRNRYWSGKSPHGNAKYKYADRWFVLRFGLADGSRVRLVRKADVKTKKNAVQRHKRQLYVHITPNPERYGPGPWDVSVLDSLVKASVLRQFHDPPEELRVRASASGKPRPGGGSTIDLKITQLDAEILPDEVIALLDATLSAAHLHQLDV